MDYALTVVPFFPPSYPPWPFTPYFMSTDHTYEFFGYSIFYAIFNLLLSILGLPIVLLIPYTFPPILPLHLPTDNPPCDLHLCDSVPILIVC